MPLPDENAEWPPKHITPAFELMEVHDAWYVGDPGGLTGIYQKRPYANHQAQYRGGVVGAVARMWWGKPQPPGETRVRLHLPLPADISTMSADLLFSEPPRVVVEEDSSNPDGTQVRSKKQEAVEKLINQPEVHTAFLEAAELASAFGGAYLRLVWDKDKMRAVRPDAISADAAYPTFQFGQLIRVVFWSRVSDHDGDEENADVYRHVECHEPGRISHALYRGTESNIGKRVPFSESADTQWLADLDAGQAVGVSAEGQVKHLTTGEKGLTAAYIPNMLPNRLFRKNSYISSFGRSDYSGVEAAFDIIDEAWTSWARDVRLAKSRIIVPSSYLDNNGGPGTGLYYDTEREVYEGLDFLSSDPAAKTITPQQFTIRLAEHMGTITEWTRYALRGAGYSVSTLGERDGDQAAPTATQVNAEERLSDRTRDKKINYWKAALRDFVVTWLNLNDAVYGGDGSKIEATEPPEIRFPSESQQDPDALAQQASLLASSQSASIMTRVRAMHPEWDGETVNAEVARIKEETGVGAMGPMPDGASYRGILDEAMRTPMSEEEARELEESEKARERRAEQE